MSSSDFQLNGSERLLWSGAPRKGVVFRSSDVLLVPFSIMWGGFAIFWEAMVFRSEGPAFMKVWGIPFVLMGLYLVIGRFFHDAWKRRNTTYALTSERVLIATRGQETSLSLRTLGEITVKNGTDGSGTISFGSSPVGTWSNMGVGWPGTQQVPCFDGIPDVRTVLALVQRAQKEAA